ncbi:heparinase II/III-family protein [Candidatus Sumerlaeota bacterium]
MSLSFCRTLVIWFLHNTFGPRHRGIRPRRPFSHKGRIHRASDCLACESRGPLRAKDSAFFGFATQELFAPIGPDYIPGHAHGDIFSFELSLKGHRVITDSGVRDYQPGPMRDYCRSTKAHNTVEIEGQDQCEFWGTFRVARRGRPLDVAWRPSVRGFRLAGRHDGYRRLRGAPEHQRTFNWNKPDDLAVTDEITSARHVTAISRLHLHPSCQVEDISKTHALISYPAGKFEIRFTGPGQLSQEESFYSPEFGVLEKRTALAFSAHGAKIKTGFAISPRRR